jgi:hypothetical protein
MDLSLTTSTKVSLKSKIYMREPLCNKHCLVTHSDTLIICLVIEHPLCSNYPCILGLLFKCPNFIGGEVVKLFMLLN